MEQKTTIKIVFCIFIVSFVSYASFEYLAGSFKTPLQNSLSDIRIFNATITEQTLNKDTLFLTLNINNSKTINAVAFNTENYFEEGSYTFYARKSNYKLKESHIILEATKVN